MGCHLLQRSQEGRRGWGRSLCAPQPGPQVLVLVGTGRWEGMPVSSQSGDDAGGFSPREKDQPSSRGRACCGWSGETEARRCSEPYKALNLST